MGPGGRGGWGMGAEGGRKRRLEHRRPWVRNPRVSTFGKRGELEAVLLVLGLQWQAWGAAGAVWRQSLEVLWEFAARRALGVGVGVGSVAAVLIPGFGSGFGAL
ncbi:hypothetical protein EDC01DRAFT_782582 [Geopyxis carbonaria]|nr:hypothetical protein EDC01DRAFT_782582 [Geopyxis carbonaria]